MILRGILIFSLAVLFLAGCGLKGSLYLPDPQDQQVPAASEEREKKERTTNGDSQAPTAPTDTAPAEPSITPAPGN